VKLKRLLFAFSITVLIGVFLSPNYSYSLRVPSSLQGEGANFSERFRTTASGEKTSAETASLESNRRLFKIAGVPSAVVPDNLATKTSAFTAVYLTERGLRGAARGLSSQDTIDRSRISAIKDEADGAAKRIFERIIREAGIVLRVRVSEGFGRDEVVESFKANEVVNPTGTEGMDDAIIDVIEGTNPFVTDVEGKELSELAESESGATSIIVTGKGVESIGNCPDYYADGIFTIVPEEARQVFIDNPLDPEETAKDPGEIEGQLSRIAEANGLTIDDLEVVVMDRERENERLEVLSELQERYPGLEVVIITDGTVAHSLVATFGRIEGKHKVVMTVGGAPEVFLNLAVSSIFKEKGALASVRIYSKTVNKTKDGGDAHNLTRRYDFTSKEKAVIEELRPDDSKAIIRGQKLFTQEDVEGGVEGSFAFITNNGVFGIEGVQRLDDDAYKVTILRVGNVEGGPKAWFEDKIFDQSDIDREIEKDIDMASRRGKGLASNDGILTIKDIRGKVISDMQIRGRSEEEIRERIAVLEATTGILVNGAMERGLDPREVIVAYDVLMGKIAEATIGGGIKGRPRARMSEQRKRLLLPTSNVTETVHQFKMINSLLEEHRPDLVDRMGLEAEVGHIDKKVKDPRTGKMVAKMTHPAAVAVMGSRLDEEGLSFDLIATNNGSGHATEYDPETLTPISQVLKISPFLTQVLQRVARNHGGSIAQHGTSGSDMGELADLSKMGVIKFNIATNYQQILLNVLSLLDDGLDGDELMRVVRSDTEALIAAGFHENTREKIKELARAIEQDPSEAEIKPEDSLFIEFLKRTYAYGIKKKKINEDSSAEKIGMLIIKEFKRPLGAMDEKLYALRDSTFQEAMNHLVRTRDNEYLRAVGATNTAEISLPEYGGDFAPGHDVFQALRGRGSREALIATNIVSYGQIEGHLLAAMDQNSIVLFEAARSQLTSYALPPATLARYIKEAVRRTGCTLPIVLHGDHMQYSEALFKPMVILKEEYEKVHGEGSFTDDIDIDGIDMAILDRVQERLKENAAKEREVITGILEDVIKHGFTSNAIDASTIYDEVAGDAVLEDYLEHGTPEQQLAASLEKKGLLSLEWGTRVLKEEPASSRLASGESMRKLHLLDIKLGLGRISAEGETVGDEFRENLANAITGLSQEEWRTLVDGLDSVEEGKTKAIALNFRRTYESPTSGPGGLASNATIADAIREGQRFTLDGRGIETYEGVTLDTDIPGLLIALGDTRLVEPLATRVTEEEYDITSTTTSLVLFRDDYVIRAPRGFQGRFDGLEDDQIAVILVYTEKNGSEIETILEERGLSEEIGGKIIMLNVNKPASQEAFNRVLDAKGFVDLRDLGLETVEDLLNDRDLVKGLAGAV